MPDILSSTIIIKPETQTETRHREDISREIYRKKQPQTHTMKTNDNERENARQHLYSPEEREKAETANQQTDHDSHSDAGHRMKKTQESPRTKDHQTQKNESKTHTKTDRERMRVIGKVSKCLWQKVRKNFSIESMENLKSLTHHILHER